MRSLLPWIAWTLAPVGLAASGVAWAQGAKDAPAPEDPAALLEQASAAYEAKEFPAALAAARRSAELAPGKDSVLAYQIWLISAEQVGDLSGMASALDAYAAIPGLGRSSVAIIDKARPRLEFYLAEQAGRLEAAQAALTRVRKVGAPDAAWLKMAERRLALREALVQGRLEVLVKVSAEPTDSLGQQSWVRAVRAEAVGLAALGLCKHAGGLAAVEDALKVPYRTPEELRRLGALQVRLQTEQAILTPGEGDPVALSKALEKLGELSPEERVWLARVDMRVEMDADWAAGRYGEVLDLREHYRSLMDQAPVESECLEPKAWLEADDTTWRAKEAEEAKRAEERKRDEEEAKKRAKRQASTGPTTKQKKVSNWLFVGAGVSAVAAGGLGVLAASMSSDYSGNETPWPEWSADESDTYLLNHVGAIGAVTGVASALTLAGIGFTVRW